MILNTMEKEYLSVGDIKKKYSGIVFSICFSLGYLMIYQLGYEAVFFNGVMIPAAVITLHASVRSRKNIRVSLSNLQCTVDTGRGGIDFFWILS